MTSRFPIYPDLRGKVALITGIGQVGIPNSQTWGNGAATARILSYNGVKIFGCDLNLSTAEYTQKRLLEDNPEAVCDVMTADLTKMSDVEKFVQAVLEKHQRIDILYNNVGATLPGDPGSMSEELWQKQIDLNLNSVFRCCRLVLPVMEKQGSGSIINNASITALRYIGKPQIGYATAKAAVIRYTKSTGVMYASKGIKVNCVVPGLMYTPLVENMEHSDKEEDREVARRITQHNVPMGYMGSAFDVANAVVFLSSDAARYVTSHELVVDGGITESTGTGFGL
ncbi:NAD(P)-binding protein [Rhizodiscina lignyota]|uniref:NAD(P)-binding protein n=1 Tax=Rhizodiscina lignyota TaxID=1504668 RepID=A0A9P4IJQ4_9PEZI|nr:NAD(P)-binding protein [Rhizodiscina lignyota]